MGYSSGPDTKLLVYLATREIVFDYTLPTFWPHIHLTFTEKHTARDIVEAIVEVFKYYQDWVIDFNKTKVTTTDGKTTFTFFTDRERRPEEKESKRKGPIFTSEAGGSGNW